MCVIIHLLYHSCFHKKILSCGVFTVGFLLCNHIMAACFQHHALGWGGGGGVSVGV